MVRNFAIVDVPEKGRCLVAARDLDPLEIVLWDRAAVVAPHHSSPTVCVECLAGVKGEVVPCGQCGAALCGEGCQGGGRHEAECSILARIAPEKQGPALAALRLLLLKERGGEEWDQIDRLMDHEEARRANRDEWRMFQKDVVDVIKSVRSDVEDALVHRLIGITSINSVSFSFKKNSQRGRALYPILSLASHSCVANARYTVNPDDLSVVLRARRKIEQGEEISIHYVPPIIGVPRRKTTIEEDWFFKCRCSRCLDVTEFGTFVSALKCSSCREGLILPETIEKDSLWRCRFCRNPFEADFVKDLVGGMEEELDQLMCSKSTTVKDLEDFMRSHSQDLHTKHYLNLTAQRQILQHLSSDPAVTREKAKKVVKLSKSFQSTMARLDPGLSEWGGFISQVMNKAQLEILKLDFQEKKVGKNSFIEESELVWGKMKEVGECEVLCTPVKYCEQVM